MLWASIVIEIVRCEENECELKAPFSIWNLFTNPTSRETKRTTDTRIHTIYNTHKYPKLNSEYNGFLSFQINKHTASSYWELYESYTACDKVECSLISIELFLLLMRKKPIVPLTVCGVPLCVSLGIHRLIKFIAEMRLTCIAFTINRIKTVLDHFWHLHPIQKFRMKWCGHNHELELQLKHSFSRISKMRKTCDKQLDVTAINETWWWWC